MALASQNAQASLLAQQRFSPSSVDYLSLGVTADAGAIQKMKDWEQNYLGQDLGNEMVYGRDFEVVGGKLYFYRTWDAGEMYMRKWAPQKKHDISISGGSENTSYNLGLGLMGQTGVLKAKPDEFDRYNVSLGVNSTVNKWLDARGKILFTNTKSASPYSYSGANLGPLFYLYRWPSNYPYGTYEGKPFRNAVTEAEQAQMDETKNTLSRISVGGTLKLIEGLTVDADYTYSNTNLHFHQVGAPTNAYDFWSYNGGAITDYFKNYQSVSQNKARYYSYWTETNTGKAFATYNKKLNNHAFKVIAGGDIESYRGIDQSSERRNLLDPAYGEIPLATGDQFSDGIVRGRNSQWATLGFFGRANYSYKDKYLLEVNGRFDGSSRFPVNDVWGFFPSMSAGYIVTQESFMDWSKPVLSFMKLRASYGSVGNQAVGGNRFLSTLSSANSGWVVGGVNTPSMSTPLAVSPTLTWETVKTFDLGVDARVLDDKLGFSFDWYNRTTSNMISAGVAMPSSFGTASPSRNFGELQGKGWELAVDFNHTFSNGLHFNVTGSLSDAQEKISKFASATKALPNAMSAYNSTYYEGMKVGEIWGYETDRLFTENDFTKDASGKYVYATGVPSQAKLESGAFLFGPGDVKYNDLNGDGIISQGANTFDDHGDKKIIGNSTPRYLYGLRLGADWKGFDVDVYFQGVGKRDLWATGNIVVPGFRGLDGWYSHQMDYWTPTNQEAFYSRPTDYAGTSNRWNFEPQSRYLLDMSYLRMKNITLGYNFTNKMVTKLKMQKLRLYISGENLLTFDNLNLPIDPEIDFSQSQVDLDASGQGFGRVYPYRKACSFGLQVTF